MYLLSQKITGYYYYFNQNGYALTGTQTIDAIIYHFDLDGKMLTGWYEENGNIYWLDENAKTCYRRLLAIGGIFQNAGRFYKTKDSA